MYKPRREVGTRREGTSGAYHSDRGCLGIIIKAAAHAEVEILEAAPTDIIMVTLWVLVVKCKLRKSLKK